MSPAAATTRAAGLALLLIALLPGAARAGSKADAFEGKIQPISGQLYTKAGRLEVSPTLDLSFNDAFQKKYFGGLKVGWHFTEFLSAGATFAMGATSATGSAVVCPANLGCRDATKAQLWQVPGAIRMMVGAEVAWAPVYGKLNLAAEQVLHFDLALLAGPDVIRRDEVLSRDAADTLAAAGGSPATTTSLGGHVGLGVRFYFNRFMALRLDFKDYVYAVKVPNWIEGAGNQPRTDIQNQLFLELGLSFFFPTSPRSPGGGP
jgi:outer membrane beta-barrel protein